MNVVVLAPSEEIGREWRYQVENQGADWRCMPVVSAQAALQLSADVLLILPGSAGHALLMELRAAPPLSPPFLLGDGAPDGPLPSPEALPAKMAALHREKALPSLAWAHLPATQRIAAALLTTLDMPARLRAWEFLPEMIALTVVHPPLLRDLSHGLYPLIASRHGMTCAAVERSLRLCVESTWTHGSLSALERFFGASVDPEKGKPTNREFLCRVQERVTLTMGRLISPAGLST